MKPTDQTCPSGACPPKRPFRTLRAEPEIAEIDLRGEKVAYDVLGCRLLGPRDMPSRERPAFVRREPRISKITLEATHACNLACRYCFVREQYPDGKTMPLRVAQMAFKRLLPRDRDIAVTFFGGEPLLAWDLLTQFVPWAKGCCSERPIKAKDGKQRAQGIRFHVTTNGTLLTAQRVAWLKRNQFSFIVSLDGPPDVHNAQRPARAEDVDSHAATLHGLALLGAAGLGKRNTIRATFDSQGLGDPGGDWLVTRLKYFTSLCRQGLAANCSIEPAFACCSDVSCVRQQAGGAGYVDALEPAYWRAADWFLREHRHGRPVKFFHFTKFLDRIAKHLPQPAECGAGFGVVSIAPDGTICACHRETGTAIGSVEEGIDEEARAPWLDNRLYAREGCMKCWARYLCGGGCRMDSLLHLGQIHTPCPWECALKQMLLRVTLWLDREMRRADA